MQLLNEVVEIYGELKIPNDGTIWYAVYTKSRHEKKVAQSCMEYNISYFLPLQESVRYYKNRVVTFMKPLFSGYIFCRCNVDGKRQLYQTGHICKFLEPLDQLQFVKELQQIRGVREKGIRLFSHSYLQRGRRVRVIRGPFKNFQGKISHRKGKYKLVLNIDLIRQAVAVEIDIRDIDLVD
ncbi:MAG: KOW motif-containing protein [Candidatus Cloacimonetes bacterium]|nr:KOW motif-containing protein [Candidatus Cloacimonadota bacterium]